MAESSQAIPPDISSLIARATSGEPGAADRLFVALYDELHRLARGALARQGGSVSLSATSLLHEAYLDMAARNVSTFPDMARFMGYAARVMRGLIIDYARNRQALKRGGAFVITSLDTSASGLADQRELTDISDALDELSKIDPSLVTIVDLKFFCGFSFAEIAGMQQVSERTVQRKWEKARICLYRSLRAI